MRKKSLAFVIPLSMLSIGCTSDDVVSILDNKDEVSFDGKVIDGYISGANVFIDLNENGLQDGNEPFTTSDENGTYSFSNLDLESGIYKVIATGGTDTVTNESFEETLTSVIDVSAIDVNSSDVLVVSPVTTLIAERYFSNKTGGLDGAKEKIISDLNISTPKDEILKRDFIAKKDVPLFKINQEVLLQIKNISTVAIENNISAEDAKDKAIETILSTGKLDTTTNISKLNDIFIRDFDKTIEYTTSVNDGTESGSDLDWNNSNPIEKPTFDSFEEEIRYIQEEYNLESDKFRDELPQTILIKPKPPVNDGNIIYNGNIPIVEENSNLKDLANLHEKIISKENKFKTLEGGNQLNLLGKVASVFDIEKKSYADENLLLLENATLELNNYLGLVNKNIETGNGLIEDFQKEELEILTDLIQSIEKRLDTIDEVYPKNLSQIDAKGSTFTTSLGDKVVINFAENCDDDNRTLCLVWSVENENGTLLKGSSTEFLDENGEFIEDNSKGEMVGTLNLDTQDLNLTISENGMKISGDYTNPNGDSLNIKHFEANENGLSFAGKVSTVSGFSFDGETSIGDKGSLFSGTLENESKEFKFIGEEIETLLSETLENESKDLKSIGEEIETFHSQVAETVSNDFYTTEIVTRVDEDGDINSLVGEIKNDMITIVENSQEVVSQEIIHSTNLSVKEMIVGETSLSFVAKGDQFSKSIENLKLQSGDLSLSIASVNEKGFHFVEFGEEPSSPESSENHTDPLKDENVIDETISENEDFPPTVPNATPTISLERLVKSIGEAYGISITSSDFASVTTLVQGEDGQEISDDYLGGFDMNGSEVTTAIDYLEDHIVENDNETPPILPTECAENYVCTTEVSNPISSQKTVKGIEISKTLESGEVLKISGDINQINDSEKYDFVIKIGESSISGYSILNNGDLFYGRETTINTPDLDNLKMSVINNMTLLTFEDGYEMIVQNLADGGIFIVGSDGAIFESEVETEKVEDVE
jgi:hypothetical protein